MRGVLRKMCLLSGNSEKRWRKKTYSSVGSPGLRSTANHKFDSLDANDYLSKLCVIQDGGTCLKWAAMGGHMEVAKLLLEHSTDVNAADKVSKGVGENPGCRLNLSGRMNFLDSNTERRFTFSSSTLRMFGTETKISY